MHIGDALLHISPVKTIRAIKDGIHVDKFDEKNISWWTNGFWGGIMWQMHALTGEERYQEIARWSEEKLDTCFLHYDMMDHDNGFKWLPTAVADYRVTGNERSKKRGLLAAEVLAGRYNSAGKFIRAWEDSTAAAIAACGLIELSKLSDGRQSDIYLNAAMKLLQALEAHSFNWNEGQDNFLTKCTGAYHDKEHEFSIIYGDYFFLEALMKLCGKELFIW